MIGKRRSLIRDKSNSRQFCYPIIAPHLYLHGPMCCSLLGTPLPLASYTTCFWPLQTSLPVSFSFLHNGFNQRYSLRRT